MKEKLEQIAVSYDKSIDLGIKGIDSYSNFPLYITNNPNYPLFEHMRDNNNFSDSKSKKIISYLNPKKGMKFIDLGCCLNLMFNGYSEWDSTYYAVDISKKTIELLKNYINKNKLEVGELYNGSMHDTNFDSNFFDIGCCIGALEYFEEDFVIKCIIEFNRLMKRDGKFVLDIPNVGSKEFEITAIIEEYLGRKDSFNISIDRFEEILKSYFIIEKKQKVGPMLQYFLICKK